MIQVNVPYHPVHKTSLPLLLAVTGARGATCMKLHQVARDIVAVAIQGMGALPPRAEQPKFLISMECASRFVRSPLSGIFLGLEEQL